MRVRQIDGTGDWTFGKGRNNYVKDGAAVAQNIRTRLSAFLGDCFFDLGAGIDWFTRLGGKDEISLRLDVSSQILNTQDVTGIINIDSILDPITRNYTLSYKVDTIYGTISDSYTSNVNQVG